MKTKQSLVYEDEDIIIYKKGEFNVGDEADIAIKVITAGLIGAKAFANHLKDPKDFWGKFRQDCHELLEHQENIIMMPLQNEKNKN